ncbi:MAG TPA: hypothetical protein VGK96_24750 [Candidatus Sulfotelmatobacter sp.]|jgi:hypothetical protein
MSGRCVAVAIVDEVYSSKCEPKFTLYPRHREACTLADYERAFNVFLRDNEMTRLRMEWKLAQLRDEEERGRALMCVTPLPHSGQD